VPNISELPEGFSPLANLDQTMASTSSGSETLSLCTPTLRVSNNIQLVFSIFIINVSMCIYFIGA